LILATSIDGNQGQSCRQSRRVPGRRQVNLFLAQKPGQIVSVVVFSQLADKRDLRPSAFGSQGLIGALAAKRGLHRIAEYGFAALRQVRGLHGEVDVGTTYNHDARLRLLGRTGLKPRVEDTLGKER
jgi:hypothetical protein